MTKEKEMEKEIRDLQREKHGLIADHAKRCEQIRREWKSDSEHKQSVIDKLDVDVEEMRARKEIAKKVRDDEIERLNAKVADLDRLREQLTDAFDALHGYKI